MPDKNIEAKILIPNSEISLIKKSMNVDVRVDAFPFAKFGSINGKISKIGAEALPAESRNIPSRFPVYIYLEKDHINKNKTRYALKAGQSITANIIIKKKRLITVITDIFSETFESLKRIKI